MSTTAERNVLFRYANIMCQVIIVSHLLRLYVVRALFQPMISLVSINPIDNRLGSCAQEFRVCCPGLRAYLQPSRIMSTIHGTARRLH
jgi:hypothetical protein